MPKSSLCSNLIRSSVGYHILAGFIYNSNSKTGHWRLTYLPWKRHSLNSSPKRVSEHSKLHDATNSATDIWTIDELVLRSGSVNRNAAVKALATWVDMHVLKEDSEGVFRLLSVAEGPTPRSRPQAPKPGSFIFQRSISLLLIVINSRNGGVTTGNERAAAAGRTNENVLEGTLCCRLHFSQWILMQNVTKFIEGMLTNLGSLPLDRIQSMLKFAPGYDRTAEQLGSFMEAARREGLVNVKDSMWRLGK